ncbi:MAG: TOBE domain-containing protein, partial [Pseudomonadota bacterium]
QGRCELEGCRRPGGNAGPQSLSADGEDDFSIQNVVPATVLEISRPQGAYVEIVLAVGAQRLRSRITARAAAALKLAPSLTVYALVKAIAIDRKSVGPLQTPN